MSLTADNETLRTVHAEQELTNRQRVARGMTEVFSPAHLIILITVTTGAFAVPSIIAGIGWGLLAALFAGVIPYGIILIGVRRGNVGDRHIYHRSQRIKPLAFSVVAVVIGIALLALLGAPTAVIGVELSMLTGLALTLPITMKWKISMHAAVAATVATSLVILYGPVWLLAFLPVAAIGWSRVVLRDHTIAQVIAGVPIGILAALPLLLLV